MDLKAPVRTQDPERCDHKEREQVGGIQTNNLTGAYVYFYDFRCPRCGDQWQEFDVLGERKER